MDMNQLTKIMLAWELFEYGVPKAHIAHKLDVHRETVHLWVTGIQTEGREGFIDGYMNAKKGERRKRKVDGLLKAHIFNIREKNRDCCGQKVKKHLFEDYGIRLGLTAIYKILGEKYILRSKWKKNMARGPVPKATTAREVIQMDSIDLGELFAFTGIDIFTKEVAVRLYCSLTSKDGADFLRSSMKRRFHHTRLLQTDGGPEFKDEFKRTVFLYADRFRVARPYKKNEQSYIESFNRSLRKECVGWAKYRKSELMRLTKEVEEYLVYYHQDRFHLGLDLKTPNEFLKDNRVSDI